MKLEDLNQHFTEGDVVSTRQGTFVLSDGGRTATYLINPSQKIRFIPNKNDYVMSKDEVIKYLLSFLKRKDFEHDDVVSTLLQSIKLLRKYGHDWPELTTIEKSLTAG